MFCSWRLIFRFSSAEIPFSILIVWVIKCFCQRLIFRLLSEELIFPVLFRRVDISCYSFQLSNLPVFYSGELIFPVLFVYPEVGETDFIEEWRESETFAQHLGTRHVFPRNISCNILIICLRVFIFIGLLSSWVFTVVLTPIFLLAVFVQWEPERRPM